MHPIFNLIESDFDSPKRIAVIGDPMLDVWVTGELAACQDGCPKFNASGEPPVTTPGGAAGACRQLARWPSGPGALLAPVSAIFEDVDLSLALREGRMPTKTRYLEAGKVIWRVDSERAFYGLDAGKLAECRRLALLALRHERFDALLVSDYHKGFLDGEAVRKAILLADELGIPCVADGRKAPGVYQGAVLQCNADYAMRSFDGVSCHSPAAVVTCGALPPLAFAEDTDPAFLMRAQPPGLPVNHVGAGDCFAAHLTLALAHGLSLEKAVACAHAAGRVYVRHVFGRPPWPHEVAREADGIGGKLVLPRQREALKASLAGRRVVFSNGVFRVLTPGHCHLLSWAAEQGDVLLVGVNDDVSARRQRPKGKILPLDERTALLCCHPAVDWVLPFSEDTPDAIMAALGPDVLVKGPDYADQQVPGARLVKEVLFAPPGSSSRHATDILGE